MSYVTGHVPHPSIPRVPLSRLAFPNVAGTPGMSAMFNSGASAYPKIMRGGLPGQVASGLIGAGANQFVQSGLGKDVYGDKNGTYSTNAEKAGMGASNFLSDVAAGTVATKAPGFWKAAAIVPGLISAGAQHLGYWAGDGKSDEELKRVDDAFNKINVPKTTKQVAAPKPEKVEETPKDDFAEMSAKLTDKPAAPTPLPQTIPYDPRFEEGVDRNYNRTVQAIDSRMNPGIDKMQGLIDQFANYNNTGKGSETSQMALGALMGLTPQVANLHANNAEQVGRLPLMQQGLEAQQRGALPMQASQEQLFKEQLPSTQAQINHLNAQAKTAGLNSRLAILKAALLHKAQQEKGNYGTNEKQKQINEVLKQYMTSAIPEDKQIAMKRMNELSALPDYLFANNRFNTNTNDTVEG